MEIEARELRRMARDVDERHHAAMATFEDEVREGHRLVLSAGQPPPRRRAHLLAELVSELPNW